MNKRIAPLLAATSSRPSAALLAMALGVAATCPARAQDSLLDASHIALAQQLVQQTAHSAHAGASSSGVRVAVTVGAPDARLRLAPCRRAEPYWPAGQRPIGRTRVGLRCVEGPTPWNITLPAQVSVFAPALVVNQPLPMGARLAAEHLVVGEVDWGASSEAPVVDSSALLGRELVRPLTPGSAVRASDLRQRQWFSAGDQIQIIARGPGFAVSTDGQALGPGLEGQPVRVKTSAGRVLSGRASGDRRVEVQL